MNIAIKRIHTNAAIPTFQTAGSAAADIAACIEAPVSLAPGHIKIIPTGLIFEIPADHEAQLRARSGLSAKHGITLANGIGTIDADYRGEVGVILINHSNQPFVIQPGMRIAQMVVVACPQVTFREVDEVSTTTRGVEGYGSTGY